MTTKEIVTQLLQDLKDAGAIERNVKSWPTLIAEARLSPIGKEFENFSIHSQLAGLFDSFKDSVHHLKQVLSVNKRLQMVMHNSIAELYDNYSTLEKELIETIEAIDNNDIKLMGTGNSARDVLHTSLKNIRMEVHRCRNAHQALGFR